MKIGILKEIKAAENRVMLVPDSVSELVQMGHELFVENGAGSYSSCDDADYESAGAHILPTSEKIFKTVELICKVQPPLPIEHELYQPHHTSFSFLFLNNNPELLKGLLKYNSVFFAAEMFKNSKANLPIMQSMSQIAGLMAVHEAAKYSQKTYGGKGILLFSPPGTPNAKITIIGAGIAGLTAARQSLLLGAQVNLIDIDEEKLQTFTNPNPEAELVTFEFSRGLLREVLLETDVLITAVHTPGRKTPVLVTRNDVKLLKPGSVIIDLSIEQGGCVETSRPTTPESPIYLQDDIVHYCVPNLPSAVPTTASRILSAQAVKYIKQIAQLGIEESVALNPEIRSGLTIYHGKVVNEELAEINNLEYYEALEMLELSL